MKATVMNDFKTALFEYPTMTPELFNQVAPMIDDILADLANPEKVDLDKLKKQTWDGMDVEYSRTARDYETMDAGNKLHHLPWSFIRRCAGGVKMLVVIESPYAAGNGRTVEDNLTYARECMADSIRRGEIPIASHLIYTQPGILDDNIPAQRSHGIWMGYMWAQAARRAVFYVDHGMSSGMKKAKIYYEQESINYELRTIE